MSACLAVAGRGLAVAVFAGPSVALVLLLAVGFGLWRQRPGQPFRLRYSSVVVPLGVVSPLLLMGIAVSEINSARANNAPCQASAAVGALGGVTLGLSIATMAGAVLLFAAGIVNAARADRGTSLAMGGGLGTRCPQPGTPLTDGTEAGPAKAAAAETAAAGSGPYRGATLLFRRPKGGKRPFLLYVFDDGLIVAQPPLNSPTIGMNQAAHIQALTWVLQASQQAAQASRSSRDLLVVLQEVEDAKGKPLHCALIPMDDIRSARVTGGPIRSRVVLDVPGFSDLDFVFGRAGVSDFADMLAGPLGGRLIRGDQPAAT
jgi:hypothetical protein